MKYRHFTKPSSGIDMTPMMDVIFLILIFFMIGASFEMNRALHMQLPESFSSEGSISEDKILIEIDINGTIQVNNEESSLNSLSDTLLKQSYSTSTEVFIMADENIPYKTIISVMDIIKILGLESISLVTEMKKEL